MKLTTKGNYAISSIIELAINGETKTMPLSVISGKLDLSENYLRQLFMQLRKAGIVESVRGVKGGYTLAKSVSDITVLDIVEAVEGPINIVVCVDHEQKETCNRIKCCSTHEVWEELNDSIRKGLNNLTLSFLLGEYSKAKE